MCLSCGSPRTKVSSSDRFQFLILSAEVLGSTGHLHQELHESFVSLRIWKVYGTGFSNCFPPASWSYCVCFTFMVKGALGGKRMSSHFEVGQVLGSPVEY